MIAVQLDLGVPKKGKFFSCSDKLTKYDWHVLLVMTLQLGYGADIIT